MKAINFVSHAVKLEIDRSAVRGEEKPARTSLARTEREIAEAIYEHRGFNLENSRKAFSKVKKPSK